MPIGGTDRMSLNESCPRNQLQMSKVKWYLYHSLFFLRFKPPVRIISNHKSMFTWKKEEERLKQTFYHISTCKILKKIIRNEVE